MNKKIFILQILLSVSYASFSQSIGIGTKTPDSSAILDLSNNSRGLLIPRMTTNATLAIVKPARGLLVYDSLVNQLMVNTGATTAPNWQSVVFENAVWKLKGNNGTNPNDQFIGTTDDRPLRFRINNIAVGELQTATGTRFWGLRAGQGTFATGFSNIGIGADALKLNTRSNTVAIGDSALFHNADGAAFPSNGAQNTAVGSKALFRNILGSENTAIGFQALVTNSDGSFNVAVGDLSLALNTNGSNNSVVGSQALFSNTTGSNNVGVGTAAMLFNTTGSSNTAVGVSSLLFNSNGFSNTAAGTNALRSNSTGANNTGVGVGALFNSNGTSNTAVGVSALGNTTASNFNTAIGFNAGASFNLGFNNTLLGANSDVNQNGLFNCVAIGESSRCTGSSQVRLGNTATSSIGGVVGYSNISDGRFKNNIKEEVKGLDFIMLLRPVTYQLNLTEITNKLNGTTVNAMPEAFKTAIAEQEKTIHTGFIAQEVEKAAKDVGYDFSGVDNPKNENDFYGLRYSEFVVPLVKAIQEQQAMIDELRKQNADLQKRVVDLEKSKAVNK